MISRAVSPGRQNSRRDASFALVVFSQDFPQSSHTLSTRRPLVDSPTLVGSCQRQCVFTCSSIVYSSCRLPFRNGSLSYCLRCEALSPTLPVSRSRQRPLSRRNRKQVSSAVDSPRLSCTLSLSFDRFYTTLGLCGSRVRSRASRRGRSYWRIAERYVLDGLQSFWGGSRPSGSEIRVEISRFARGCEGVCGRRSPCQGRWRWMLFWGEHFKSPHRLLHLS